MEVHLSPDVQAKLNCLAGKQGRDTEALAQEAIARFVDYDEWFIREVEKGLASAERGELLTHEEVGTRLERLIVERQSRRQMQLRWSEEADDDLERITNYLFEETPQHAPVLVRAIYNAPAALL